jgi:beta-phosphoglucomutase family hydrolase
MLGLPESVSALLFDLDGVLTDTASVHFAAWRETFDPVLAAHGQGEFTQHDYDEYVDGRPREDGVRSLLAARGIHLPEGSAADDGLTSVLGIANAKNDRVLALIKRDGVTVYEGSRQYLHAAAQAGLHRAVVSSSANAAAVLEVAGLAPYVEQLIDGNTLKTQHLQGKPAPDSFLAGARALGVAPAVATVFEDAVAGVAAGRAGGFGFVVGVNRLDGQHGRELWANGANMVVTDLGQLR